MPIRYQRLKRHTRHFPPAIASRPRWAGIAECDFCGSHYQTGAKASFSNFGATSVQIAAPGVNTNSTKPTNNTTNLLFHNFDSNPTGLGYTFSGSNNSWGFTNTASFSAPTSMTDSPAGNYLNNTVSRATGPIFSTAGQRGCRLESRLRLATQSSDRTRLVMEFRPTLPVTAVLTGPTRVVGPVRQTAPSSGLPWQNCRIGNPTSSIVLNLFLTPALSMTESIWTMYEPIVCLARPAPRPTINFCKAPRWPRPT